MIKLLKPLLSTNRRLRSLSVTTDEDKSVALTLVGSDPNNDPINYTVVSQPLHGQLSGTGKNLTYMPQAEYSGTDSFTFKVNDGKLDSNVVSVNITVNHANGPRRQLTSRS